MVGSGVQWTYQEHNGHVQEESDQSVQEEGEETNVIDLLHRHLGDLPENGDQEVHDGTHRGKVVERDQRVHLVLGRAQEPLDHGETHGLEDNTCDLQHETDHDELDLAERGNDDTDDDSGDVQEDLQARLADAHRPAAEQDSDGGGGLEHLDEGD
jgi:hypothetical protein